MENTEKTYYKHFTNEKCEYYPCHKMPEGEQINCMFCYCPLYALGKECGGDFTYTEKGRKNCSGCTKPHGKDGYEHVMAHIREVLELVSEK